MNMNRRLVASSLLAGSVAALFLSQIETASSQFNFNASDPGVRGGAAGGGKPFANLTTNQLKFFDSGAADFAAAEEVDEGLGPRMNLDSCGGCHIQPALGGTSPFVNPQVAFATKNGGTDKVPSFIRENGPVREARFVKNPDGTADGGVHAIFTITGRTGANVSPPGPCTLAQPDFATQLANNNVIFRIPTPTFGAGLIEQIPDAQILANQASNTSRKQSLGIRGKPNFHVAGRTITGMTNNNGNDGTIARFGWKAQNKSLVIFSGEAYNVEMGVTNELFPDERGENGAPDPVACRQVLTAPQDTVHYEGSQAQQIPDDANNFANFMRFLDAPTPVSSYGSVTNDQITAGEAAFNKAGCNVCHKKSMTTGNHANAALRYKAANLFSDLLVHDIGTGDGISQGLANGSQFRSAPLWGVGQRLFFLHDGRTDNLVDAINAHGGEATPVTRNFNGTGPNFANRLTTTERQNLVYFLRSL